MVSASVLMICDFPLFNCLISAVLEKGTRFNMFSRRSLGTPVERRGRSWNQFLKVGTHVGFNTWGLTHLATMRCCRLQHLDSHTFSEVQILNYNTRGLTHLSRNGCVVNYNTWCFAHLVRIRCVLNYDIWGLTRFAKTRRAVNYNNWALTHLVRTRRALKYNTWGSTHLVTDLCFESCSRTLDEIGVFQNGFHTLLGESDIWVWNSIMQKRALGHRRTA